MSDRSTSILLLIGGAVMLAIGWSSHILNVFQALDYIQTKSPALYAFITSAKTQVGLTVVAVLMIGYALILLLRNRSFNQPQQSASNGGSNRTTSQPNIVPEVPRIEDDPDVNALNLRITNDIERGGLNDCILYLHRRTLIDRRARTPLPSFQVMRLTSNHHNIPYMEERRYQLLEFTNPSQPFFRSYNGTVDLPCMGLWRLDMELTWYGGKPYQLSKCLMWESGRSPYFVSCPTGGTTEDKQANDDPRVYLSVEARQVGRFSSDKRNIFVANNQGGSEARNVKIEFPLQVGTMVFETLDLLAPKDSKDIIPEVSGEQLPTTRHDIFSALNQQPNTVEEVGGAKEYPFTLTYENHNLSRRFECQVVLIYRSLHESFERIHNLAMSDAKKIVEIKHGECRVIITDRRTL
jgi:hypothetical protein